MAINKSLNSELNYKQFYKELGHLLYAVAYSDGKIRKKEVEALREFILKHLAPFEPSSDSSGMNQAFYAQFEFEDIADKNEDATIVFSNFMDFLQRNKSNINEHLKSSMIQALEKVQKIMFDFRRGDLTRKPLISLIYQGFLVR